MNNTDHLGEALTSVTVKRVWGTEIWLANTKSYCAKYLDIYQDLMPVHYHPIKDETMINLSNRPLYVWFKYNTDEAVARFIRLNPNDSIFIEHNTWHTILSCPPYRQTPYDVRYEPAAHLCQGPEGPPPEEYAFGFLGAPLRVLEVSTSHKEDDVVFKRIKE